MRLVRSQEAMGIFGLMAKEIEITSCRWPDFMMMMMMMVFFFSMYMLCFS